jgi:MSHA biogenesis protein MshE
MILVTGPTGSGKTSTLYASLAELNSEAVKIITVEDPVEYRLSGITQVQINEKIELDFAKVLRATLRQDPDVILLGEIRDSETADIGLRAAITGHMVLSTLHTRDAVSTPFRLLDMGVPPFMVATSLQAVVAQRLLRLNCDVCAEPHALSPQESGWLTRLVGQGEPLVPKRGRGCSACHGTGYAGRQGVYEMLEMNTELARAASQSDPTAFLKAAQAAMQGRTLVHHAFSLVRAGRTSVAEAMRVGSDTSEPA